MQVRFLATAIIIAVGAGCSATEPMRVPDQEVATLTRKGGDGGLTAGLSPYIIDASGDGRVTARWEPYAGLPSAGGVPQHAIALAVEEGAGVGSEAGVWVTGIAGRPVPPVLGVDVKGTDLCGADGGLRLDMMTESGATISLDCAKADITQSPIKGAEGWTRVAWTLDDLTSFGPVRKMKAYLSSTARQRLELLLGGLFGMDAQPAWPGLRVYVTDVIGHRVIQLDSISSTTSRVQSIRTLGSRGSGALQFERPTDVYVDGSGSIHIADSENGRLARFDDMAGTGWVTARDYGCTSSHELGCIVETVASDGYGGLLSHIMAGSVYRMTMTSPWRLTSLTQNTYVNLPSLHWELDAFADYRGRYYLTRQGGSLWRYDNDQMLNGVRLQLPVAPTRVRTADRRSLFVDDVVRIYVADLCRITRYDDMTGAGMAMFPATGCFNADFAGPAGVSTDKFGRIYFVTTYNGIGRVHRMDNMQGAGLVVLATFPSSQLVSVWVDDRVPPV